MIIDIHTHAFPDTIVEKAMRTLLSETDDVTPYLDGRVASLLASMDRAGIAASVLCSIATKPEQFGPILNWSRAISSDRIIPFPSVHPNDPDALLHLTEIRDAGFKGVKLHPYYQNFYMNEARLMPLYERIAELDLILVMHTGFDVAFPRDQVRGDPEKIMGVMTRVPTLKMIATHLGAWQDWDNVIRHMLGRPVLMEPSYSLDGMPREQARRILTEHPAEYLLFGTDSPWKDQSETLRLVREMELPPEREAAILGGNAKRLLEL